MPKTKVVFYKDETGQAPVLEWLKELQATDRAAYIKCTAVLEDLEEFGHELRRPSADLLQDGVRELRAKSQRVQYRILYFFSGKDFAVLAHAIIKKDNAVPSTDIERALKRKQKFQTDPRKYTWEEDASV